MSLQLHVEEASACAGGPANPARLALKARAAAELASPCWLRQASSQAFQDPTGGNDPNYKHN
jgi:hypothetical protein